MNEASDRSPSELDADGEVADQVRSWDRCKAAHRIVQLGLFFSLVWKFWFFVEADKIYANLVLEDDFFPTWLQSHWTMRLAYLGSLVAICGNFFFFAWPKIRVCCAVVTLAGMTILCLHQGSYNDATFTTAWWTSLWTTWFVLQHTGDDKDVLRRAAFLSRLIVSMIVLGGATGKWTAEYWSGEVIYEIYFLERDFWVFNWLRDAFDAATQREIAKWYSRGIVLIETACGLGLWLLPPRTAAGVAVVLLTSIAVFSNWLLFSVLLSLIGLSAVGFFVEKPRQFDPS